LFFSIHWTATTRVVRFVFKRALLVEISKFKKEFHEMSWHNAFPCQQLQHASPLWIPPHGEQFLCEDATERAIFAASLQDDMRHSREIASRIQESFSDSCQSALLQNFTAGPICGVARTKESV
jgi:hypothetical protein